MAEAAEEQRWRTDDMSLAAFLAIKFPVLSVEWHGNSCYWFFEDSDELADEVSDYAGDIAKVNPREHSSMVGRLKREMFSVKEGV